MNGSVRFAVLGPLLAEDEHGPLDLKGPRHRAVLARLLIARGQVVPVKRLVDDLWTDPPDNAVGAIQTFVGALRRALEPERKPRAPARLLVTTGPGYALHAEAVDAWRFADAVAKARELPPGPALSVVDEALTWWRGPAYAEFADQPWARAEIARLDELRLLARERRAGALLDLGRAAEAVPELRGHAEAHPLREEAWRLLALGLYRAGRQGDALAALREARAVLVRELGVDPGPELRKLESAILDQAPALDAAPQAPALVGRDTELTRLTEAARRPRLVLVSGEAGAGKTALAEAFTATMRARGWATAWGRNPEHEGVPAGWAWSRILDELGIAEPAEPEAVRRHLAVRDRLAERGPLLLVLDDLQWADEDTLALLSTVVENPGPVLVVATYRTTDVAGALSAFLGRAARGEPVRIYLGGLPAEAVPALVRDATGREIDSATARAIHQRSGGNPFFVRELARVLDTDGELTAVPAGVRDVVRYRLAQLPDEVRTVLRRAAVIGTDLDLDLLPGDALDAVETATARGFLVERGPSRFGFAHALVRDALYADLFRSRRARLHAETGELIERLRPDDVVAQAHHFLLAGSPAAGRYARAAAEDAERRFAPHEAARLWRAALEHAGPEARDRLDAVMGLVRALVVTGRLDEARTHRAEALALAERVGEPELTARVLTAFDVPAIWTDNDDPALAGRIAAAAERTLADVPAGAEAVRARLCATLALELRNTDPVRGGEAAREAESLARRLGDPALLGFALNARFMQCFERAGLAPERARIGRELVELASRHDLVTFEVLGHLVLVQACSALADFDTAARHAGLADALGDEHRIPLVGVFTEWFRAMRLSASGQPAEAAYRSAAARLRGSGMSGVDDGILGFALLCDRIRRGADPGGDLRFGAYEPWCRPVVADDGAEIPDSPRDLLFEARTCLHAVVALRRGDRAAMRRLYAELLPAEGELAGAGSGVVTFGPVAEHLVALRCGLG